MLNIAIPVSPLILFIIAQNKHTAKQTNLINVCIPIPPTSHTSSIRSNLLLLLLYIHLLILFPLCAFYFFYIPYHHILLRNMLYLYLPYCSSYLAGILSITSPHIVYSSFIFSHQVHHKIYSCRGIYPRNHHIRTPLKVNYRIPNNQ